MGCAQFSLILERKLSPVQFSHPGSFWSLWAWSSEALGEFSGLFYLLWTTSGTSNFKKSMVSSKSNPLFQKVLTEHSTKVLTGVFSVSKCVKLWPQASQPIQQGHSRDSSAGTALLWENQSSGSCTGLYIRCCLFCCQLYRNPLPKPCNCRMFCYPIPPAVIICWDYQG